jgi:hypothetical protein
MQLTRRSQTRKNLCSRYCRYRTRFRKTNEGIQRWVRHYTVHSLLHSLEYILKVLIVFVFEVRLKIFEHFLENLFRDATVWTVLDEGRMEIADAFLVEMSRSHQEFDFVFMNLFAPAFLITHVEGFQSNYFFS